MAKVIKIGIQYSIEYYFKLQMQSKQSKIVKMLKSGRYTKLLIYLNNSLRLRLLSIASFKNLSCWKMQLNQQNTDYREAPLYENYTKTEPIQCKLLCQISKRTLLNRRGIVC